MKDGRYFQCLLRNGPSETTAWIEERGAKAGCSVELLPARQMWDVVEVFQPGMDAAGLKEIQLLNRGSLPSIERMA